MTGIRRWLRWLTAGLAAVAVLVTLLLFALLPSSWFREQIRERIVREAEQASGGRVTIGRFVFDWKQLRAEVGPFVLRGTEPEDEPPLFRAESIVVGFKIVSFLKRDIDLRLLEVRQPQIHLLVDAQGRTNLPTPRRRGSRRGPVETLLNLAVEEMQISRGFFSYRDQKVPLEFHARGFSSRLTYDARVPRYEGWVEIQRADARARTMLPVTFALKARIGLEKNRLAVEQARLDLGQSRVDAVGSINNFSDPQLSFRLRAQGEIAELGAPFQFKAAAGQATFDGQALYSAAGGYLVAGRLEAQKVSLLQPRLRVHDLQVKATVRLDPQRLTFDNLRVAGLGGHASGALELRGLRDLSAAVELNGISLADALNAVGAGPSPWSGRLSGPVQLRGRAASWQYMQLKADLAIAPGEDGSPVSGRIQLAYDQGSLLVSPSWLRLPSTQVQLSGAPGQQMQLSLTSHDLGDFLPLLRLAAGSQSVQIPVKIQSGGSAAFRGTIYGPLNDSRISGRLEARGLLWQNWPVSTVQASLEADRRLLRVVHFQAAEGALRLSGRGQVSLDNWRLRNTSPVQAQIAAANLDLEWLWSRLKQAVPVAGIASADLRMEGTAGDPRLLASIDVRRPRIDQELLDSIRLRVRYAASGVEIIEGLAVAGGAPVRFAGLYEHPVGDGKNGRLRFDLHGRNLAVAKSSAVQRWRPGLSATVDLQATGAADIQAGELRPASLSGRLEASKLVVDGRPLGDVTLEAHTEGGDLLAQANAVLRGARVTGSAAIRLEGDYQARGQVFLTSVRLSALRDLALPPTPQPPPFDGVLEGHATFEGPLKKPEQIKIRAEFPLLQLAPERQNLTPQQVAALTLRNSKPLVLESDANGIHFRSFQIEGSGTNLTVAGLINLRQKNPWNLKVGGKLNLQALENFSNDIRSEGTLLVSGVVRGPLEQPLLSGQMELQKASFYLVGLPNGLDNVNGIIRFDLNRATIERLTAETGGGSLQLSGFMTLAAGVLNFNVRAEANQIRVRYPEGVSTTLNASLSLTGSPARSTLSGVLTVVRAGFNPRTDVGGLLAASTTPLQTPATPNETLRSVNLDLHVETAPNLQLQTTLTSDIQAEADLRVRGTAARPVVLGRIFVNQGEIQFFGTKYTINRGEIGFYNPARIEPVINLDLETRVRGVLVSINFSGSIKRLNVSYRSDPPLQSSQIIALLAVGRAPDAGAALAASQTVAQQSFLASGANTLLGQALSAPISGRLQRFFGVSRLKIDPQLQNLDVIPQARVTIEQQISPDITLTYITNLNKANQQIVRLEWDLNRTWSVLAVRDENGYFGIDFLYKKRFR